MRELYSEGPEILTESGKKEAAEIMADDWLHLGVHYVTFDSGGRPHAHKEAVGLKGKIYDLKNENERAEAEEKIAESITLESLAEA